MLLGNDLDNFHNFFHQLLMLWIIHVVLLLMSRLVHIFSSMLSFVSTSSLTVFVFSQVRQSQSGMLPVFRFSYPSSTLAHRWLQNCASSVKYVHHCLLLHCAVSGFNRPIADSFHIFQTCNRPIVDFISRFHQLILKLIRLVSKLVRLA